MIDFIQKLNNFKLPKMSVLEQCVQDYVKTILQ